MADMVVGRADEVRLLDALLADAAPEPRALLIEGEPGIGKTTLLQGLVAIARERGYPVLSCRPARSEMDLSYVGLVELLAGVDEAVVDALPAPQARVLRMILRTQEPQGRFDRLSLSVAVVAALRAMASTGPLLVAVDDTQWLDHPTARILGFAVRRLDGTAIRVAVVRSFSALQRGQGLEPPRPGGVVDWPAELARAMGNRLDTLRLGPNDASELSRIVRRVLGWVPAWPLLVRIAELSGGNPLYALELTRAVGLNPGADLTGSLPDNLVELARSRIARLPRRVRDAVGLASVPRNPTLDLLRRLDSTALDLRDSLVTAARAGIVTFDGERIRFTHPILAAVGYGSILDERRRDLHRAVAMLSDDLEERARHLAAAASEPDPQVAATLEGAAEQAWRRGAPDTAADLLGLACRLTPLADADAIALRRVVYGRLLYSAGDVPGALAELTEVAESLPPGLIRARALFHLMYVTRLSGSLGRAVDYGVQAAEEAADDPSFQAEVLELLSRIADNDIALKLSTARQGLEAIGRVAVPDPYLDFHVRAALVEAEFYAGLGVHLERLDGLDAGPRPRFPPVRSAWQGDDMIGRLTAFAGQIDEGIALLQGFYDRAMVESRSVLPAVLAWMAEAQILAGRFEVAATLTGEAIDRRDETGTGGGHPWEVGFHAVALAQLGRLDEAEAFGNGVLELAAADPTVGLDVAPALLGAGITAMARGRFDEAVSHLRQLDRAKREAGIREPRLVAHAGDLIEALVAVGELDEATEVLQRLEAEAATSGGRWSHAVAGRGAALIQAARGQLDEALAAAERSRSLFDGLPMPFERARTVFVLGQVHRRRREKGYARAALTEALATFEELATPVWAERARAELARIPLRRAASSDVDSLTATEERIARMVADGLTNREIADRVFLSPKTVEVNLTRIYRKLGVRSRAALASRFAGS